MDVYGNETIHVDMIRLYEGRGNCMNVAFIPVRGGSKSIPFKNNCKYVVSHLFIGRSRQLVNANI